MSLKKSSTPYVGWHDSFFFGDGSFCRRAAYGWRMPFPLATCRERHQKRMPKFEKIATASFVEPRTAVTETTVVLVAVDGPTPTCV